ncbi:bifunctional nicotinamidase/pyrazinamidase [Pseudochelatococcus sp. G4_1912]|uniref:bifunctional nicotinamidase/pyrazinamidase n=1 Tax=Pseudochelatococcus sp. G4_1912 TaxID=3114288 RepID=UPI0039C6C2ED
MAHKPDTLLLVIDVQNDFITGGSLAVDDSKVIIPIINRVARQFTHVALTQDWHPAGHASFASSHPGMKNFDTKMMSYGPQTLWPDHCVQDTHGAAFHADLDIPHAQMVVRKGYQPLIDSYSAFFAADRVTATGLADYLRDRGVHRLVFAGLATDFCVAWSALDARKLGFEVLVLEDACRGINLNGSVDAAWHDMIAAGVTRTTSSAIGVAE